MASNWRAPLRERIGDFGHSQSQSSSRQALPVARTIGLGAGPVAGNLIYRVLIMCLLQHDALPDQKHR